MDDPSKRLAEIFKELLDDDPLGKLGFEVSLEQCRTFDDVFRVGSKIVKDRLLERVKGRNHLCIIDGGKVPPSGTIFKKTSGV